MDYVCSCLMAAITWLVPCAVCRDSFPAAVQCRLPVPATSSARGRHSIPLEFRESAFNPRRCTQATNNLQYYSTVLRVDFAEIFLQCNIITQFPPPPLSNKSHSGPSATPTPTWGQADLYRQDSQLGVVVISLLSTSRQLFVFSQFKCGNATAEVLILFGPRQAVQVAMEQLIYCWPVNFQIWLR